MKEHDQVYYAVIDNATGLVVNSGQCPRKMVDAQATSPGHRAIVTSDSSAVRLVGCTHEDIRSGFMFAISAGGARPILARRLKNHPGAITE